MTLADFEAYTVSSPVLEYDDTFIVGKTLWMVLGFLSDKVRAGNKKKEKSLAVSTDAADCKSSG